MSPLSPRPKVLAVILAGGPGTRLAVLTDTRAKPAMPFAGIYRLIDFPLSNCLHSGLSDVWVIEQYQPVSLSDHLANGRPWDLDRTHGGLLVLHPFLGMEEEGFHEGTADAIYRNAPFIREFDPDLVLVMSSDHIYTLDYREVIDRHLEADAAVTMVTVEPHRDDPGRFGVVEVDDDGRITNFLDKPDDPPSGIVAAEVYVFDADKLLDSIEEIADEKAGEGDDEDAALEDLDDDLLPRLVEAGAAVEYRMRGYWRDVGTISSYWGAHMDLLEDDDTLRLNDPEWPIHTLGLDRPPARLYDDAQVRDSFLSPGCSVRGTVERSVLGPDVHVMEGATVRDSVVLSGTVVASGAVVETAIVDAEVLVGERAQVGGKREGDRRPTDEEITIVGKGAQIAADEVVERGARVDAAD